VALLFTESIIAQTGAEGKRQNPEFSPESLRGEESGCRRRKGESRGRCDDANLSLRSMLRACTLVDQAFVRDSSAELRRKRISPEVRNEFPCEWSERFF